MKLKNWKKRVKELREVNKRTRVYFKRYKPFALPSEFLEEGGVYNLPKLEVEYLNFYGEKLDE